MASRTSLLTLPRELRDMIYAFVLSPSIAPLPQSLHYSTRTGPIIDATSSETLVTSLPDICKVSSQLYWEVTPLCISASTLAVQCDDRVAAMFDDGFLPRWLASFNPPAFSRVPSIEITRLSPSLMAPTYSFLTLCVNLRSLKLGIKRYDYEHQLDIVYERFGYFNYIFDLPHLEEFGVYLRYIVREPSQQIHSLRLLSEWFAERWKEMGKDVAMADVELERIQYRIRIYRDEQDERMVPAEVLDIRKSLMDLTIGSKINMQIS